MTKSSKKRLIILLLLSMAMVTMLYFVLNKEEEHQVPAMICVNDTIYSLDTQKTYDKLDEYWVYLGVIQYATDKSYKPKTHLQTNCYDVSLRLKVFKNNDEIIVENKDKSYDVFKPFEKLLAKSIIEDSENHNKNEDDTKSNKDYADMIAEKIEKANNGDISAMQSLALYYFDGFFVEQDYLTSLEWSLQAAKAGDVASMFNVGVHYYYGYAGVKDSKLALKWYQKAADKMFPKALNTAGQMYYLGNGTDMDIAKGIDYTLQSAGFLHHYSMANMVHFIKDKNFDDDIAFWYRLAAKNYRMPSSSNNEFYKELKNGKMLPQIEYIANNSTVPNELTEDIILRYYSGTLVDYLNNLNKNNTDFQIKNLDIDAEQWEIDWISSSKWFDKNYLIDINNDSIDELISYKLEGTMGTSKLRLFNYQNGKYIYDEANSIDLYPHGITGIVNYQNKNYLIIANVSIGDYSIWSIDIYPFNDSKLAKPLSINFNEDDVIYRKTYQKDASYDELNTMVEARISTMFFDKYNSKNMEYDKVEEKITLDCDINNDGKKEHIEYKAFYWGTINVPIFLDISNDTKQKDLALIHKATKFNDLITPLGIEIFTVNKTNYLAILGYQEGTNNYALTTYKLEKDDITLVLNHLISFHEYFTVE